MEGINPNKIEQGESPTFNEEERRRAIKVLNLDNNLSPAEIGSAYYRFELAQKGPEKLRRYKEVNEPDPLNLYKANDKLVEPSLAYGLNIGEIATLGELRRAEVKKSVAEALGLSSDSSWKEIRAKEEENWLKENWENEEKREELYKKYAWVGEKLAKQKDVPAKVTNMPTPEVKMEPEPAPEPRAEEPTAKVEKNEPVLSPPQEKISPGAEKLREVLKKTEKFLVTHGETAVYDAKSLLYESPGGATYLFGKEVPESELKKLEGKRIKVLELKPDLDARTALFLMNLAGIDYSRIAFGHKGQTIDGGIHLDTGERPSGITVEGDTAYIDHHQAEKGEPTSASDILYKALVELENKEILKNPWLKNLIKFVNDIDNLSYTLPRNETELENSCNTLYGIYKGMSLESLYSLFKRDRDPSRPFTLEEMKEVVTDASGKQKTIGEICQHNLKAVENSFKGVDNAAAEMNRTGTKTETPELGKVLINFVENQPEWKIREGKRVATGKHRPKNDIPKGFLAVKAKGYDTYVAWYEDQNSFFITSLKDLSESFKKIKESFPDTKIMRGTMIISNIKIERPDNFEIEKLLGVLGLQEKAEKMPISEADRKSEKMLKRREDLARRLKTTEDEIKLSEYESTIKNIPETVMERWITNLEQSIRSKLLKTGSLEEADWAKDRLDELGYPEIGKEATIGNAIKLSTEEEGKKKHNKNNRKKDSK